MLSFKIFVKCCPFELFYIVYLFLEAKLIQCIVYIVLVLDLNKTFLHGRNGLTKASHITQKENY